MRRKIAAIISLILTMTMLLGTGDGYGQENH